MIEGLDINTPKPVLNKEKGLKYELQKYNSELAILTLEVANGNSSKDKEDKIKVLEDNIVSIENTLKNAA